MSSAPAPPAARDPLAPLGTVVALLAVGAVVLAFVRPWGDVGVTATGGLALGAPVLPLALLTLGAVAALVVALGYRRATPRHAREVRSAGAVVVALGVVDLIVVLGVVRAQVLPRDGGWWGLLAAVAVAVTGLAVVAAPSVRSTGRTGRLVTLAVVGVVPVALVVVGAVVAPGWPEHRLDASHPATFSEAPGPATVTRVAWRQEFGTGSVAAVLGGRAVVARDVDADGRCAVEVRALDAGTGRPVWSVTRPLRCDGPRLVTLDGNSQVVRLALRGDPADGPARTGGHLALYLDLESGRPLTPAAALDGVVAWTEGFGLVVTDTELRGLDPRTGRAAWTRSLPRCADGRPVTVGLPPQPPADTLVARSPYDAAHPPGAVPVVGAGRYVVVGVLCGAEGGLDRRAWFVDATGGPDADRTVTLPAVDAPAATGIATTFLPWLDTVIAAVPATADGSRTALAALDLATGRLLWQREPAVVTAIDLSVTTGDVQVSAPATGSDGSARTQTLGVRTGSVLAGRSDASPVLAAVALTAARVELTGASQVTVVPAGSDGSTGSGGSGGSAGSGGGSPTTLDLACSVPTGGTAAPLLPGPGGVVVRCDPSGSSGVTLVGLVA